MQRCVPLRIALGLDAQQLVVHKRAQLTVLAVHGEGGQGCDPQILPQNQLGGLVLPDPAHDGSSPVLEGGSAALCRKAWLVHQPVHGLHGLQPRVAAEGIVGDPAVVWSAGPVTDATGAEEEGGHIPGIVQVETKALVRRLTVLQNLLQAAGVGDDRAVIVQHIAVIRRHGIGVERAFVRGGLDGLGSVALGDEGGSALVQLFQRAGSGQRLQLVG